MSSTPRNPGAPGARGAKSQPAGKKPAARAERKAPTGQFITPQALAIVFGLILVIGLIAYYQMVVVKYKDQMTKVEADINATQQRIDTYRKKSSKLEKAKAVNNAIRDKLNMIGYLFLANQDSVVPFFEDTLFPILEQSALQPVGDKSKIEVEEYTFKINMAMKPFETLPGSRLFEDAASIFRIDYIGEKGGVPEDSPLNTQPSTFLYPYNIKLVDFGGTYEDAKDFIEQLQTAKDDILITVHCVKNNEGDNAGLFRTSTTWTIALTVYFMNPEASASGDAPPDPPGSHTC